MTIAPNTAKPSITSAGIIVITDSFDMPAVPHTRY